MKQNGIKKIKEGARRGLCLYLALTLLFEVGFPSMGWALTGGPSQPEVQSFEPVGTSEMVDPFSGDFTYNIPLLDVDGYPINISYHSNITMDQEATWVGLGWNINPGVINRGMRGIPDDFRGENITKEFNMKPNRTYGLSLGTGIEFFGLDDGGLPFGKGGVGYELSVRFNNYTGVGVDQTLTGHLPLGNGAKTPFNASLGITSSSDNGLTIQPSVGFSVTAFKQGKSSTNLGLSVGTAFNSRAGMSSLTISATVEQSRKLSEKNASGSKPTGMVKAGARFGSTFNFGMPTYTPELTLPFTNFAISASFKWGPEVQATHWYGKVGGYYACQKLAYNTINQPAYGYLHADEGVKYDNAIMDFNREKDGVFNPSTPALAVPNYTYDLLSVSGQGIGGSYRPFRSDFGQVFDPYVSNTSTSGNIGVELGTGVLFKLGVDLSVSDVSSQSGRWKDDDGSNGAFGTTYFTQSKPADPTYERFYYKEANEKSVDADPSFFQKAGKFDAQRFNINPGGSFNASLSSSYASGTSPGGTRSKREKRSQAIEMLSRGEIKDFGLIADPKLYASAPSYHTAEITSYTPDGRRYVYGIAAYNTKQEETTFAVGKDEFGGGGLYMSTIDCNKGLVQYAPGTSNSVNNVDGMDNYYSNTILPPYSHSYFLTAALSPDYVDVDNVRGPSKNDLGSYTKFNYTRADSNYRWRVPLEHNTASHSEGLKWTNEDDKANYVYGEKELWYLESVETKNYIAKFSLENREDGYGVTDKNGGLSTSHPMKLLRKISLYTKVNYDAHVADPSVNLIPIKEVHFEYDYSLCQNIPNNNSGGGKLTLKKVSFSYQSSSKARLSPYSFVYSTTNPNYNIKGYDRWGNYKPQDARVTGAGGCDPTHNGLSNAEFPYVEQNKTNQDQYASAWALDTIKLPSGGSINVDYESDDYAYVQNKRACQMFKVKGLSSSSGTYTPIDSSSFNLATSYVTIELSTPITGTSPTDKIIKFRQQYLEGLDYIYFRFMYEMSPGTYEYVPGYIPTSQIDQISVDGTGQYAFLHFATVSTNDNGGTSVCPITKAAIQFGRLNEPKNVWGSAGMNSNSSFGLQLLQAFVNSGFVHNIADAVVGPNEALYTNHFCCSRFSPKKSWLRFDNPTSHKLGGGSRVKRITVSDAWSGMTSSAMSSFAYGQEYSYDNEDGTSSGVASYEPQLGGDENPWHTPVFFDVTHLLAPDDAHYLEEPFGEAFFPSPSIGYGRVTVSNLKYNSVSKHATGKVVHEFWTAKDFPTITSRTDLQAIREKTDPLSLSSFLGIDVKDYMTASQGFYIELNDMHGKPRGQKVYQEGIAVPISSIEYDYKKTPYGNGSFRLNNTAQVISPTGGVSSQDIGLFSDFVTDFREQSSSTIGASLNLNLDMVWAVVDVPVFTAWPGFSSDATRFRSSVVTRVVNRFGLLEKTIAKDLGSKVETDNLAYDSETGDVILTKTINDYNDPVYNLNYPAYWYFDGMGPAYKNLDIAFQNISFSHTTGLSGTITNAKNYFVPGDEIEMYGPDTLRAYTLAVNSNNTIKVEDKSGFFPATGSYNIKVLRSGRRNMQSMSMAGIAMLQNPLAGIGNNIYDRVINASAIEYSDQWNIFCECSGNYHGANPAISYVTGAKGNWRKKRSFAYLTGRSQSMYDRNTNTRKDGVFTSYNPLYKKTGSKWQMDTTNWTFTSKVTIFNPNGQELENIDPLGRYSAAEYGYNQTFATAVSANSRFRELGFDNAEDYDLNNCSDKHFKFSSPSIDTSQSHTGRRSIKVSSGTPVEMTKVLATEDCVEQPFCDITMSSVCEGVFGSGGSSFCTFSFAGAGAQLPLTISWVITNGSPHVSLVGGSKVKIISIGPAPWHVDITVTGATGCQKTFPLNVGNN